MQIAVYNIRLIAASVTVRCKTYDSKFALAPNHSEFQVPSKIFLAQD